MNLLILTNFWDDLDKTFTGIMKLALAVCFFVVAVWYLVSVIKKRSDGLLRLIELLFWLLWIVILGLSFSFSLKTILQPQTYMSLGILFFIITRIVYLVIRAPKGRSSKK